MKQVMPGRVPSKIGFAGSIVFIILALLMLILINSQFSEHGEGGTFIHLVFMLVGVVIVVGGIGSAIYSYKNAFSEKRISEYDIVEQSEEDESIKGVRNEKSDRGSTNYCPYCGNPVKETFLFCPNCGERIK
ncbi:zinc ribbon domain-containing protein [Thermodesulfovibrio sp. 3907-1M]|uniref:Zinc ribbon domain-containing protein n=1 Tax=Thermodesulfovibrio autotrophicus TaxID=3118333 RepID=A0AAU8GU54_9BACT